MSFGRVLQSERLPHSGTLLKIADGLMYGKLLTFGRRYNSSAPPHPKQIYQLLVIHVFAQPVVGSAQHGLEVCR